nr:poxin isoform X1 [Helicoverpa armigera]
MAVVYLIVFLSALSSALTANLNTRMSQRTGFPTSNTPAGLTYRGLVERMAIPAELHRRADGRQYASFGDARPIHCCTPEQVEKLSQTTHHYCDIFTEQLLAPLGELGYVRIDENTAEKVFINRSKRLLVVSSDGVLAQWRLAPTFESANLYVAGTPVVNQAGELVSLVTAKRGNHYAVSTFEGEGGYFDTSEAWQVRDIPEGRGVYGDRTFPSRDELRAYVSSLPPIDAPPTGPPTPILWRGATPRLVLLAKNGRQISHQYLHGVSADNIEYL